MSTILDALFCHDARMSRACARHEEEQINDQEELSQRALDCRIGILHQLRTSAEDADQFLADHEIKVCGQKMTGEAFGAFMLHELAWACKDSAEQAQKRLSEIWSGISDYIDEIAESEATK